MAHTQKPDFVFPRNGRVHLNRWGASVQSTTGSRGVRISSSNGSNAGQTTFRGKVELYWLRTPFACFPFTSPPVRHRVPPGSERALTTNYAGTDKLRQRRMTQPIAESSSYPLT